MYVYKQICIYIYTYIYIPIYTHIYVHTHTHTHTHTHIYIYIYIHIYIHICVCIHIPLPCLTVSAGVPSLMPRGRGVCRARAQRPLVRFRHAGHGPTRPGHALGLAHLCRRRRRPGDFTAGGPNRLTGNFFQGCARPRAPSPHAVGERFSRLGANRRQLAAARRHRRAALPLFINPNSRAVRLPVLRRGLGLRRRRHRHRLRARRARRRARRRRPRRAAAPRADRFDRQACRRARRRQQPGVRHYPRPYIYIYIYIYIYMNIDSVNRYGHRGIDIYIYIYIHIGV